MKENLQFFLSPHDLCLDSVKGTANVIIQSMMMAQRQKPYPADSTLQTKSAAWHSQIILRNHHFHSKSSSLQHLAGGYIKKVKDYSSNIHGR